jgi:periplasmic copper chaperone A
MRFNTLLLTCATIAALHGTANAAGLVAKEAYSYPTLKGTTTTAVYVTVENTGDSPAVLTGGSSDVAAKVELHDHVMQEGGIMQMVHRETVEIPAGKTVSFEPGGLHIMLMGMKQPLAAGESVSVTLTVKDAEPMSFTAKVKKRD